MFLDSQLELVKILVYSTIMSYQQQFCRNTKNIPFQVYISPSLPPMP